MPAHWIEKGRNAAPDFPAWAWLVGQIVSAKASLELLQRRVKDKSAPWPEFSEYDCYACHHQLADAAWRRSRQTVAALNGLANWGSWYIPMANAVSDQRLAAGPAGTPAFGRQLEDLRAVMSQPFPVRERVIVSVKDTIDSTDRELAGLSKLILDGPIVERLIRRFDDPKSWQTVSDWDHAAQRYLALVPQMQAWKRLDPGKGSEQQQLAEKLHELLKKLEFKNDTNSPRQEDPAQFRPVP
jgi:hypothetical protein